MSNDFGLSPLFEGWPPTHEEPEHAPLALEIDSNRPRYLDPVIRDFNIWHRERLGENQELQDELLIIDQLYKIHTLSVTTGIPLQKLTFRIGRSLFEIYVGNIRIYNS